MAISLACFWSAGRKKRWICKLCHMKAFQNFLFSFQTFLSWWFSHTMIYWFKNISNDGHSSFPAVTFRCCKVRLRDTYIIVTLCWIVAKRKIDLLPRQTNKANVQNQFHHQLDSMFQDLTFAADVASRTDITQTHKIKVFRPLLALLFSHGKFMNSSDDLCECL